jgi:hypothetical protein
MSLEDMDGYNSVKEKNILDPVLHFLVTILTHYVPIQDWET